MATKRRTFITIIAALAILANVIGVGAQEKKPRSDVVTNHVFVGGPGQIAFAEGQGDNTFLFVSTEMSIDGKLVKGAPYSAQAINESVQTLAGGNRIVRHNTSTVYRDSEGRTRRDQTISVVGNFAAAGEPAQTTFINDPVAGVNYILDAKNKTARKIDFGARMNAEKKAIEAKIDAMKKSGDPQAAADAAKMEAMKAKMEARKAESGDPQSAAVGEKIAIEKATVAAGARDFTFEMKVPGPGGFGVMKKDPKNTRTDSLGKQTIEGVECEGTRATTTIAAGEIGNELPIEVVFERWYSPELQTVVMTKQSDPRFGENTYRLTNINRSEPPHSLFEVPADYTIQEAGPPPEMRMKLEREARRPGSF
ncbi:MAG TPA: hypothetical protein VKN18_28595 [Blastocatellia bacterium]|nr:hypothetical protein [Blastocatellia bacterium]